MSAITDERRPDDPSGPADARSPPGGRPGRDALRQMGRPHRARYVQDVIARAAPMTRRCYGGGPGGTPGQPRPKRAWEAAPPPGRRTRRAPG